MKAIKFLCISLLTVFFSGCAGLNMTPYANDPVETKVVLSESNYHIVKEVSGEWSATYVFGIGGLSKKALNNNAISEMYKNAELQGNQQIINITTARPAVMVIIFQKSHCLVGNFRRKNMSMCVKISHSISLNRDNILYKMIYATANIKNC